MVSIEDLRIVALELSHQLVDLRNGLLQLLFGILGERRQARRRLLKGARHRLGLVYNRLPGVGVGRSLCPRREALKQIVESQRNSGIARDIEVCLEAGQSVYILCGLPEQGVLLPYRLFGILVPRADHLAGPRPSYKTFGNIERHGVECLGLRGITRSRGVRYVVLCHHQRLVQRVEASRRHMQRG